EPPAEVTADGTRTQDGHSRPGLALHGASRNRYGVDVVGGPGVTAPRAQQATPAHCRPTSFPQLVYAGEPLGVAAKAPAGDTAFGGCGRGPRPTGELRAKGGSSNGAIIGLRGGGRTGE